jgi:hypothetical protein
MGAGGAERTGLGVTVGVPEEGYDDRWAIERRRGDRWVEVERLGSRELAESRLDELAAEEGIDLANLRVRPIEG